MRVRAVPVQPHCFNFGGFDIQMHRTLEALRSVGVDAAPLDWWSRDADFDILHVWGLAPQHQELVRLARQYGKKVALTPLLPYNTPVARMRHFTGVVTGRKRAVLDVLRHVDVLLVVNSLQADAAIKLFGFPANRIEIIPTILDPRFFSNPPVEPPAKAPARYIVCAGNIWPRKNQLRLAQAALTTGTSVVFIGNTMAGEHSYTAAFENLVAANPASLQWHKWLSWDDLFRTLRHAAGIALPSFLECQPASGLEAAALGKPLLLACRAYARQEFYSGAVLVNPKSVTAIARGLESMLAHPERCTPASATVQACRIESIATKLRAIFERLLA
jgi:glycosyltransferase involved in cell wall biosynthesis